MFKTLNINTTKPYKNIMANTYKQPTCSFDTKTVVDTALQLGVGGCTSFKCKSNIKSLPHSRVDDWL